MIRHSLRFFVPGPSSCGLFYEGQYVVLGWEIRPSNKKTRYTIHDYLQLILAFQFSN